MNSIKLYPVWEKAYFSERVNRFVMALKKNGEIINAYVANPGRMEEYLVPGHPFFITPTKKSKFSFRVVSTFYENSFILLDTIKVNHVVELMLRHNKIPEFVEIKSLRREVTVKRSRFDFFLEMKDKKPVLLEVKSCSLCHSGVAMFPDAPTERGRRHLMELESLANRGYETFTLYLLTNRAARVFIPNCHTDPEYGKAFNRAKGVRFLAYRVEMPDPVTLDISLNKRVVIDFEKSRSICKDRGSYLLVIYNEKTFSKKIGALGEREFVKGYYVYVGSALRGLKSRISRHMKKRKKIHWHLDYIFPYQMKKVKVFKILSEYSIEKELARAMSEISPGCVPGFGSSDTGASSHLFYFPDNPVTRRDFLDLLLDFRMFVKE